MSWTSEHDPPSGSLADGEALSSEEHAAEAEGARDIPDDGPLDPSIFDGLFDDLTDGSDDDDPDDNPLDEFLSMSLVESTEEEEGEQPGDAPLADDGAPPTDGLLVRAPTEGTGGYPDADGYPDDELFDQPTEAITYADAPIDDLLDRPIERAADTDLQPIDRHTEDELFDRPTEAITYADNRYTDDDLFDPHRPTERANLDDSDVDLDRRHADGMGSADHQDAVDHYHAFDEPVYDEPVYDEPVYDEPAVASPTFEEPRPVGDQSWFDRPGRPSSEDTPKGDDASRDDGDDRFADHLRAAADEIRALAEWTPTTTARDDQRVDEWTPPATTRDDRQVDEWTPPATTRDDRQVDEWTPPATSRDDRQVDEWTPPATTRDDQQVDEWTRPDRSPSAEERDRFLVASPAVEHDHRHDHEPYFEPIPEPAETGHPYPTTDTDEPRLAPRRRLVALTLAILIGSAAGLAGAALVSRLNSEDAQASGATDTADAADGDEIAAGSGAVPPGRGGAASDETIELTSLRFASDSNPPRLEQNGPQRLLADALGRDPTAALAVTIRTYSETTASEDLALSRLQAEALEAQLIEMGVQADRVSVVGVGRSLLSPAQPVPNFVVASGGLGTSHLTRTAERIGPFAIGIDRTTGELRVESQEALTELAQAMVDDPGQGRLTLAAYSFDRADSEANERQAGRAVEAAADYLVASGIDRARLTTIVAGAEPFAVTDEVANHIHLRWGEAAEATLALERLGIENLDFESGTANLTATGVATVDALAGLMLDRGTEAIVDVHSFDGGNLPASVDLSVARAQAIGQHLVEAGVPVQRIHLHGGASPQFRSEQRSARILITLVPPADP